jgi:formylglycine-generating enzyme required for sulfatase activity
MSSIWRDKAAVGGALGLALLVGAFAYRWAIPHGPSAPQAEDAETAAAYASVARDLQAGNQPSEDGTASSGSPRNADSPEDLDEADDVELASAEPLPEEARAAAAEALTRARAALEGNRLIAPEDDSALYWFEQALARDRGNSDARAGRRELLRRLFEEANAEIDRGDTGVAEELLAALGDTTVFARSRTALGERVAKLPQVLDLLTTAAQRMSADQRVAPEGASALDSYRAALALDARNAAAQQGLAEIERGVLSQALAAASQDVFADADRLLEFAAGIRPGSQELLQTRTRVLALKRQRAAVVLERARAALDGRDSDTAAELIERARALDADAEGLAALQERLANARIYDHFNPGETFSDPYLDRNGNGPELVVIALGEFTMGSRENERDREEHEGPAHRVRVARPFALARTEVTVAQFRRFVGATGYVSTAERKGSSMFYDEPSGRIAVGKRITWKSNYLGERARDNEPVVHVSYDDVAAYAVWLTQATGKPYRLPSEAEFEYTLRAGTATRYWWGDDEPDRILGNFTGDGDRSTSKRSWNRAFRTYNDRYWGPAPVGRFAANPFGVFDLDGNVSEWVDDCWHDSYRRAPDDATAWVNPGCARRVVRGGSWGSAPEQFRSAFRLGSAVDVRSARVGFRVARDL